MYISCHNAKRTHFIIGCVIVLLAFLLYFLLPNTFPENTRRAIVLFCVAAGFWAFEVIPLFATSISLVAFLTLFITTPGSMSSLDKKSFTLFFSQLSNPIILLFFGGFILAKALSKHTIDQYIAKHFFRYIGTTSFSLLFGHLALAAFLSLWISNTAAAAMVLSLIHPLLSNIPKNDPLQKGLPIAVAFGASIGGIATPIGTPPNALAIGILAEHGVTVSFLAWMAMALPLAIIIIILTAGILWFFFSSKTTSIQPLHTEKITLSKEAKWVVIGAIGMIVCWLTSPLHKIPESLIALFGVSYFAAFRLITLEDLKSIDWDVLLLMWGGLALGEAMIVSNVIPSIFGSGTFFGTGIWLFTGFCVLALILSSFMSNTATANLLLPVIASFSPENKILLSITIALSCSLALTFPIATPPNAMAYSFHTFSTKDMFKVGSIISLLSLIIILLGFDRIIPFFFSNK